LALNERFVVNDVVRDGMMRRIRIQKRHEVEASCKQIGVGVCHGERCWIGRRTKR
jgi:hypothetical protein